MPRKNFENFGDLQQYEYVPGVIDAIDGETDTCAVTVGDRSYSDVPIYYHCNPGSPARENGAIEGAAAGFDVNHHVVVLRHRTKDKQFVIGHIDGVKRCVEKGDYIIIVASKSGNEAFAWDLNTDSLLVEKDTLENVEAQLKTMEFEGAAKKLAPSETAFAEFIVTGWDDVIFELPGLFNQPNFYITDGYYFVSGPEFGEDSETYYGFKPADTVFSWGTDDDEFTDPITGRFSWREGEEIFTDDEYDFSGPKYKYNWQHSIIKDPHTEEARGCFVVDYDDPLTGLQYVHFLFDADPNGCVSMSCDDLAPFTQEHPWPGEYGQELFSWAVDGNVRKSLLEQGIASNTTADVCFESIIVCDDWESENELCSASADRHLRIFARKRAHEMDGISAKAFELINFERAQRGIEPLVWNHVLHDAAERHATDEAANLFYGHTGSDGSAPEDRIIDAGFIKHYTLGKYDNEVEAWRIGRIGENVGATYLPWDGELPDTADPEIYDEVINQPEYAAKGHAEIMIALWMASLEGHRENMLADPSIHADEYTDAAVVAMPGADGGYYWALNLGVRYNFFPGYAPVPTDGIEAYMDSNFEWSNPGDKSMMPDIYLI